MAGKVTYVSNRSLTLAIEVCLTFIFDIVFDFKVFPVPPSKAQFIGNDLMNGQNTAISPCFFSLL
jgi:hypothetical protein